MEPAASHLDVLERLVAVIEARKHERADARASEPSYVRDLMNRGTDKICEKVAEEASELCRALRRESDARVAEEAADLLFHVLVGLVHRGLSLREVTAVLAGRFGRSGIDEKAGREG